MKNFIQYCYFYDRDVFKEYDPDVLVVLDVVKAKEHYTMYALREGVRLPKRGERNGNPSYYFNCAAGYEGICQKRVHQYRTKKWL